MPTVPESSNEVVELQVRVHLLESDELDALNATFTDPQVDTLFGGINEIWGQADIVWRVESILHERALNADAFRQVLAGQVTDVFSVLLGVFPRDSLLRGAWNVFIIGDLADIAGGVYLREVPAILFAQSGPRGDQGATGRGPRILAHELGHSLSLLHVPCTAAGNLMSPGCDGARPDRLTSGQVAAARRQAAAGRPF